jgi:hypothetical protein
MRVVALGLILAVAACGGGDAADDAAPGQSAPAAQSGPTGGGSIGGTIAFTGAAPANPAIDMAQEAKCREKYTAAPTNPIVVVNDGKLGNVFVYVKSGLPAGATYTAPTTPVVLDQDGCLYHPRVFGVMANQPIEILNSDPVLHNIKAVPTKNRGFNISQPSEGMKTTRDGFPTPEVMVPLECNVHGWMNAYAGVMSHPFFAVSGENGTFEITRLPAGTYEIEAWHETLGTKTMSVTVTDDAKATADFSFASTGT